MLKSFKKVLFCLAVLSMASCAVVKATNQPGAKDLSVLDKGTPRATVIAELGKPVLSEIKHGQKVDVFNFISNRA